MKHVVLVLVLAACGGSPHDVMQPPPPPAPAPYDPAPLAAAMHAELVELAAVVVRDQADCKALARELKPVFARMQASVDEAKRARTDPDVAKRLTTEMHRYDDDAAHLTEQITTSFAYCQGDGDVREVMATMPTL